MTDQNKEENMRNCPRCSNDNNSKDGSYICILCKEKKKVTPISSVEDFLSHIKSSTVTDKKYYRGESQYYRETSLQPSIVRRPSSTYDNLIKQ
ncbi:MAG TPA: hypothetical protein CFH84_03770, partial [Sulfurimonas sp. UBA12504]